MKNYISQKSFSLSTILIYLFILLCMKDSALGWTTPFELTHVTSTQDAKGIVVGRSLYIVAIAPPSFIFMSSWNNGFSWTAPVMPADTFYQGGLVPAIAADSFENLHIVYRGWNSGDVHSRIFHIKSTDGGRNWGPERQRLFYTNGYVDYPSVTAKGYSLFVICRADNYILFIRSLNEGGGMER